MVLTCAPGLPQTPLPAPTRYAFCPISVEAYPIKGRADETIFALWADDASGSATGTIAVYADGLRYTIPFADSVAADVRDAKVLPTPLVVPLVFSHIDSAYVDSIAGSPCPAHSPYVSSKRQTYVVRYSGPNEVVYPDWRRRWQAFLDEADARAIFPLPPGSATPEPACAKPYVGAYTIDAVSPREPYPYHGLTITRLEVAPDGSLIGARVEKSSGRNLLDQIALGAISASRFAATIYRCEPASGNYYFYTYWNP